MSGLELAGVVLGAFPVIIEALSAYRAQRGLLATFRKSGGLLERLIHQLKMQKVNFYLDVLELLREARVPEILKENDPGIDRCVEILQAVKTGDEVKEYLGSHIFEDFLDILRLWETDLVEITSKLSHIIQPQSGATDDLGAIAQAYKASSGTLVFRGKLRFTMDRERIGVLLNSLKNEEWLLQSLLKRLKTRRKWEASEPTRSSTTTTLAFSRVQESATSLYWAASRCWDCEQHSQHSIMLQLEHRIPDDKEEKPQASMVTFHLCFPIEEAVLQRIQVSTQENTSTVTRTAVKFVESSTASLKSSLQVPSVSVTEAPNISHPTAARARITSLCKGAQQAREKGHEVLSLVLTSSACLEICERSNESSQLYAASISLADFLQKTAAQVDMRMSPLQQTHLALKVVSSVLQLRSTMWCSVPWTSTTIKFPIHETDDAGGLLFTPYLEQSIDPVLVEPRRGSLSDLSTQQAKTTMLNLAILLLEILHHTTISTWTAQNNEGEPTTYESRFGLAVRWLERSQSRLLPHHLKPVEQCLALCVRGQILWDTCLQQLFCENIIKPLRELAL